MKQEVGEISKNLCLNIKLERVKIGWTQEKLASAAGVHINTIGKIERCEISPTIDTVVKIANAMGIKFSTLTKF